MDIVGLLHQIIVGFWDIMLIALPLAFYLTKVALKPSVWEIEVMTKLLVPVMLALVNKMKINKKDNIVLADNLHRLGEELRSLKQKFGKGPLG